MMQIQPIKYLANKFFMSTDDLIKFCNTAPHRYKTYEIPKKNSTQTRTIAQPSKEVKILQRSVLEYLKPYFPVHEHSFAYTEGRSIKHNAYAHKDSNFILKIDLSNFFNSITPCVLKDQLSNHNINIIEEDFNLLSNLLFWRKYREKELLLSVGAPTSPFISNFIMYNFDCKLVELCNAHDCNYTRYADDITISSCNNFYDINLPHDIRKILFAQFGNKLKVNNLKTKYFNKAHHRTVTGITISNDKCISIGHKKKRLLSAQIHNFKIGKLTNESHIMKLKGHLSFAFHIQPQLKAYFASKYGAEIIDSILKYK